MELGKLKGLFIQTDDEATPAQQPTVPMSNRELGIPPGAITADARPPTAAPGASGDVWAQLEKLAGTPSGMSTMSAGAKSLDSLVAGSNIQVPAQTVNANGPMTAQEAAKPIPKGDGTYDFRSIYAQAGVPAVPYTVEQALELIHGLPNELPIANKRQVVFSSLRAISAHVAATPQGLVTDAALKLKTLHQYSDAVNNQADQYARLTDAKIAQLEAEINQRKQQKDAAIQHAKDIAEICKKEYASLDEATEFFTLDVGASTFAAPTV